MTSSDDVKQFLDITGANEEQAIFYLESSKGDVNAAVTAYFENSGEGGETSVPGAYIDEGDDDDQDSTPALASSASQTANSRKSRGKATTTSRSGINTLGGLQQSDEDDDDDDKPAELYTGGEKSGLGVIDPSKKKDGSKKPANLIQELLRKAAAGGQQQASPDAPQHSTFRGSGYTLGGEEEESRKVEDPNEAFRRAMATQPTRVQRVLKLWKDGFSVDDGRLYRYDDPTNKDFLDAINKGHAPLALLNVAYGQPVDVTVEKRTDEPYLPPPKVFKPFESSGHRLGNASPPAATSVSSSAAATTTTATTTRTQTDGDVPTMDLDDTKPTTSLQIRLASGARIVSTFNTSHTLSDVYGFVARHPQSGSANGGGDGDSRTFQLLTPYPRREFARDDTTIEAAGLLKGVLQQKLT